MKAVLQRTERSSVEIDGIIKKECGEGLTILLGIEKGDSEADAEALAEKISKMRIFPDENYKMNLSVIDINGSVLIISNFTLCADYKRGNRPDYIGAAAPEPAERLYEYFVSLMRKKLEKVETGKFGAMMKVEIINNGPVTIIADSKILLKNR